MLKVFDVFYIDKNIKQNDMTKCSKTIEDII